MFKSSINGLTTSRLKLDDNFGARVAIVEAGTFSSTNVTKTARNSSAYLTILRPTVIVGNVIAGADIEIYQRYEY